MIVIIQENGLSVDMQPQVADALELIAAGDLTVHDPMAMILARVLRKGFPDGVQHFIQTSIAGGRYNNASEVIRAALRRLEEDEARLAAIRAALIEGEESGIVENFDPTGFMKRLNEAKDEDIQAI